MKIIRSKPIQYVHLSHYIGDVPSFFAGLRPATLLKERLWHRCFPVNFAKFLGTLFLQNMSGRLLVKNSSFVPFLAVFLTMVYHLQR